MDNTVDRVSVGDSLKEVDIAAAHTGAMGISDNQYAGYW
jgi:hypothetical protein